jgi:hypothetical protein
MQFRKWHGRPAPEIMRKMLFNVWTVTLNFLSHCCHSFQVRRHYTPSAEIGLLDQGIDRYFGIRGNAEEVARLMDSERRTVVLESPQINIKEI